MYDEILVPVDGSSFAEQAIPYARAIASRVGAHLQLVLVHTPLALHTADIAPVPLTQQWEREHREAEASYLDQLAERLNREGVDVTAEKLDGDVAHTLVERAKSGADLLVMTTHGRAGLERAWLGSVAEEVVHHVRLPVVIVRPQGEEVPEVTGFDHILIATDGSTAARAATDQAFNFARLFDARVTLLRVVSVPAGLSSPYIPHAALIDQEVTEDRRVEAERSLEEAAARAGNELSIDTQVRLGYHPARGILDAIPDLGCDLVALGTHRKRRLARIVLGSVADKVLRASTVPVLVGHAEGEARE